MSTRYSLPEPVVFFATHQVELAVFMHLADQKRATYGELARVYPTIVDWPLENALEELTHRGLVRYVEGHANNAPVFRTYFLTADGSAMARAIKQISIIFPNFF